MANRKVCAKCGAVVPADSSFCYQCGSNKFIEDKEAPAQKQCAKCGTKVDLNASFCFNCGSSQFLPGSISENTPKIKTCKRCGTQTDLSASFCEQCGYDQFISGHAAGRPNAPAAKKSTKKKGKKKLKWWAIVLIILGVCIVAALGNAAEKQAQKELSQQAGFSSASRNDAANATLHKDGSNDGTSENLTPDQPVIAMPEYDGKETGDSEKSSEETGNAADNSPQAVNEEYQLYDPVIHTGQDAFGYDYLRIIVPIVNTSSENQYLCGASITVCDANGVEVKEISATAYPSVIGPGEAACYVAESRNLTLSDAFPYSVTNIERTFGSGDLMMTANHAPLYYAVANATAENTEKDGLLYSYTVINDSAETAEKGTIVASILLYDENDMLLDVLLNGVNESLAPGESKAYERIYAVNRDYETSENCSFTVSAFRQYATNN